MKKIEFKKFSIKKLLVTILYTVIISVFIGTTTLFLSSVYENTQLEIINSLDSDSETLIEIGKAYQEQAEQIDKKAKEEKELYGEDYPSEGISLYKLISIFSTNRIMRVYSLTLIIGIVLGTIIYIVAIQKASKKQIIIELIVAFMIIAVSTFIINIGYEMILNKAINEINPTKVQYSTDIDIKNILILYVVIAIVAYAINMIRQRILTNKLNKQLNMK